MMTIQITLAWNMIIFHVDVPTSINLKLFRAVVSRLLVFITAYNSFCFCYLFSIKVIARDVLSQQFLGSGHFRVAKKIYPRVGSGQHTT